MTPSPFDYHYRPLKNDLPNLEFPNMKLFFLCFALLIAALSAWLDLTGVSYADQWALAVSTTCYTWNLAVAAVYTVFLALQAA